MKVVFAVSPRQAHQVDTARLLGQGLIRHGDTFEIISNESISHDADAIAVWGWRKGEPLHKRYRKPVLVMERAYIGDRFVWASLGWNGLNGRATFPVPDDGARWNTHFAGMMKPWRRKPQGYALVIGQVPTDTACRAINFSTWLRATATALQTTGWDVKFRPHPKAPGLRSGLERASGAVTYRNDTGLEADFEGAAIVVTFNSNAGVLAVLNGVPTVTCDPGSMAWEVSSHDLKQPLATPDRTAWAHRIAFCQWLPQELSDGTAWAAVRAVMPVSSR